jgi:HD domain
MGYCAQTHLQLYRQLRDASYSDDDIVLVDRAYQIAMRIFAGHYRPNNKPFLMHLVGVASILVNARQPAAVVAAGLLHSAYLGRGRKGSQLHRKQIAQSLGPQIEELIHAYSNRNWSALDFGNLQARLDSLTVDERQLYAIKLADIHEEFLDDGILFQPQKKLLRDEDSSASWLQGVREAISALGYESWAQEFQLAVDSKPENIPAAIRGKARSSYIQAPGLLDSRLKNKLVRWLARVEFRF